MDSEKLVKKWFELWKQGDFRNLPLSEQFRHSSPYGIIEGRKNYIDLVDENKDKFLGYHFEIHDEIYGSDHACVRYKAIQGEFSLEVSEWYYIMDNLIEEIVSYYHIDGKIKEARKISYPDK